MNEHTSVYFLDNDASFVTEQSIVLRAAGMDVRSFASACQFLDSVSPESRGCVIADLAMPEMSGDQLAIAIKQVAPERPIIMLTGFGDLMDAKGEKPVGVDVIVGKPVTFDALQDAILQVVTRA